MSDTPPAQAQNAVSGNVAMYRKPEPLDREAHKGLGLTPSDAPFGFATDVSAVPVNVAEFGMAAVNYPIIFAGDDRLPLAILGIRPNENVFVEASGEAERGVYLPAFIRRYPFVLANDEGAQRMVVCLDREAEGLTPGGPLQLFEDGEPTAFTKDAMKFCEEFEQERARTQSFVQLIKDLDLLEVRQTLYTPPEADSKPIAISEYFAITDERLAKLPNDKILELVKNGALAQIHAHMMSLNTWDHLVARSLKRGPLDPTQRPVGNA